MDLSVYFKSVLEQDTAAVVLCNLEHEIIYMNPAATARYAKHGGSKLVGKSLLKCHNTKSNEMIEKVVEWFAADKKNNIIYTSFNSKENMDVYMVALRDDGDNLVGYYEKHEYRNNETMEKYDFK